MKKECCSFTGAEERGFGESWSKYKAAVFIYAPLETKKVVKLLLRQYLLEEDSSEGMHAYIHTYVRYLHTYHTYIYILYIHTYRTYIHTIYIHTIHTYIPYMHTYKPYIHIYIHTIHTYHSKFLCFLTISVRISYRKLALCIS